MGRNEGKLEEKRNTLKEQLIIKLGAVSNRLEEQLTNASLEKLNILTRNIFNITGEEDVLRIITKLYEMKSFLNSFYFLFRVL